MGKGEKGIEDVSMYQIVLRPKARKELLKFPSKDQKRIGAAIDSLIEEPFAGKQLQGDYAGLWSLRVWPYRVIYTINQKNLTVTVLKVGNRQGVYR